MMHFIPARVLGVVDHLVGVFAIFAPWLFDSARGRAETWAPVLGTGAIAHSLMTDCGPGVARARRMRTHLALDGSSGAHPPGRLLRTVQG